MIVKVRGRLPHLSPNQSLRLHTCNTVLIRINWSVISFTFELQFHAFNPDVPHFDLLSNVVSISIITAPHSFCPCIHGPASCENISIGTQAVLLDLSFSAPMCPIRRSGSPTSGMILSLKREERLEDFSSFIAISTLRIPKTLGLKKRNPQPSQFYFRPSCLVCSTTIT